MNYKKRKLSYGIKILLKARCYFDLHTLITLHYAFNHSHLNYCITSWGQTYPSHLSSLHVQNQAIRIITNSKCRSHVTELYRDLNILCITNLVERNVCILAYWAIKDHHLLKFVFMQGLTNTNNTSFSVNNNFFTSKSLH